MKEISQQKTNFAGVLAVAILIMIHLMKVSSETISDSPLVERCAFGYGCDSSFGSPATTTPKGAGWMDGECNDTVPVCTQAHLNESDRRFFYDCRSIISTEPNYWRSKLHLATPVHVFLVDRPGIDLYVWADYLSRQRLLKLSLSAKFKVHRCVDSTRGQDYLSDVFSSICSAVLPLLPFVCYGLLFGLLLFIADCLHVLPLVLCIFSVKASCVTHSMVPQSDDDPIPIVAVKVHPFTHLAKVYDLSDSKVYHMFFPSAGRTTPVMKGISVYHWSAVHKKAGNLHKSLKYSVKLVLCVDGCDRMEGPLRSTKKEAFAGFMAMHAPLAPQNELYTMATEFLDGYVFMQTLKDATTNMMRTLIVINFLQRQIQKYMMAAIMAQAEEMFATLDKIQQLTTAAKDSGKFTASDFATIMSRLPTHKTYLEELGSFVYRRAVSVFGVSVFDPNAYVLSAWEDEARAVRRTHNTPNGTAEEVSDPPLPVVLPTDGASMTISKVVVDAARKGCVAMYFDGVEDAIVVPKPTFVMYLQMSHILHMQRVTGSVVPIFCPVTAVSALSLGPLCGMLTKRTGFTLMMDKVVDAFIADEMAPGDLLNVARGHRLAQLAAHGADVGISTQLRDEARRSVSTSISSCMVSMASKMAHSMTDLANFLMGNARTLEGLDLMFPQGPDDVSTLFGFLSNSLSMVSSAKVIKSLFAVLAFITVLSTNPFEFSFGKFSETVDTANSEYFSSTTGAVSNLEALVNALQWLYDVGLSAVRGKVDLSLGFVAQKFLKSAAHYIPYDHPIGTRNFDPLTGETRMSIFEFSHRIDDLILEGQKAMAAVKVSNPKMFARTALAVSKLTELFNRLRAFQRAQSMKEAPFGVIIVGRSSIAKSTFLSYMKSALAVAQDLPIGDAYTFVMNPTSNFPDGFHSNVHTIVLDDMGAAKPRPGQVDLTVTSVIPLGNNVPVNMESANVNEKGKNYWTGKFLLGTTNIKGFNAHAYFTYPAAAIRRMEIVVSLEPKKMQGSTIDLNVAPKCGIYYNAWSIHIEKVILLDSGETDYDTILRTDNVVEALEMIVDLSDVHFQRQASFMSTQYDIKDQVKCPSCNRFASMCKHLEACDPEKFVSVHGWLADAKYQSDTSPILLAVSAASGAYLSWFCLQWFLATFVNLLSVIHHLIARARRLLIKAEKTAHKVIEATDKLVGVANDITAAASSTPNLVADVATAAAGCAAVASAPSRLSKYFERIGVRRIVMSALCFTAATAALLVGIHMLSGLLAAQKLSAQSTTEPETLDVPAAWSKQRAAPRLTVNSRAASGPASGSAKVHVLRSIVKLDFRGLNESGQLTSLVRTFGCSLGSQYSNMLVLNKHVVKQIQAKNILSVQLSYASKGTLVSGAPGVTSVTEDYSADCFSCHDSLDFAVMRVQAKLPTGVYKYLMQTRCCIKPDEPELMSATEIVNVIDSIQVTSVPSQEFRYFFVDTPTSNGDCGRPLVGLYNGAFAVLGIHGYGDGRTSGATTHIAQDDIDSLASDLAIPVEYGPQGLVFDYSTRPDFAGEEDLLNCNIHVRDGTKHTGVNPEFVSNLSNIEFIGCTGELDGFKSQLVAPRYVDAFADMVTSEIKVKPDLDPRARTGYLPKHVFLTNVGTVSNGPWNLSALEASKVAVFTHLSQFVDKGRSIVTLDDCINGLGASTGLEGLDMSTGFGFPTNKKKAYVFNQTVASGVPRYSLPPDFVELHNSLDCQLHSGVVPNFVFKASRKDEPIKMAKLESRGPRLIFGANTFHTLLLRKYFGSLLQDFYRHRIKSGLAVGINQRSAEWTMLYRWLTEFSTLCIAGDFANFDQRLHRRITKAALDIWFQLAMLRDGSRDYAKAIITLLATLHWFYGIIDTDIYLITGPNPSGQALTTQTNCICVLLLLVYVWVVVGYDPEAFFSNCRFTTYGDDHVVVVKEGFGKFTYDAIATVLEPLGMGYTSFDKTSAYGKTYDDISAVQFLKRHFNDKGFAVFAPIDKSAIDKRLTIVKKAKGSVINHEIDVLSSVWDDSWLLPNGGVYRQRISEWFSSIRVALPPAKFPAKEAFATSFDANTVALFANYWLEPSYKLDHTLDFY